MSKRSRERYMRYRRGPLCDGLPIISPDELNALTPEGMAERYARFIRLRCLPLTGQRTAKS